MEKLILDNIKNITDIYSSDDIKNAYLYMSRSDKENDMYYIFKVEDILTKTFPIKYKLKHMYMMLVPKNPERKAYVYDKYNEYEIKYSDVLYKMSYDEWLNTFRIFVKYDGEPVKSLPVKLIQDI